MKRARRACCVMAFLAVTGCAAGGTGGDYPLLHVLGGGRPSDLALADLAKGDFRAAERHALLAVESEPDNPYALLAAALVYENSGRPELARRYYGALATLQPPATATLGHAPLPPQPVGEIALSAYRRLAPTATSAPTLAPKPPAMPADPVASRFDILARLLAEHLIAEPEYQERRAANLGGLLPHTAPPPPARLQRPPPAAEQFVQRLQGLAKAFEMRAIGAGEYAAERTAILNGLLPGTPAAGGPPQPPRDELARAAAIGRLERLQEAGLITSAEAAQERRAMDAAWAPAAPVVAAPAPAGPPPVASPPAPATGGPRQLTQPGRPGAGGHMTVHLASLKADKQAWDEWTVLQARFPQLKGLAASVSRTDLGSGKGVVYRLTAGPLDDAAAVDRLCRALRAQRQYCAPAP